MYQSVKHFLLGDCYKCFLSFCSKSCQEFHHSHEECEVVSKLPLPREPLSKWLMVLRLHILASVGVKKIDLLEGCNDNNSVSSKLCQNTLTRLGITKDEAAKYHAILQNNTFRRESGRCLCPAMAMLNHNCDPNCRVYWSGKNCKR